MYLILLLMIGLSKISAIKIENSLTLNYFSPAEKALVHIFQFCDTKYDTIIVNDNSTKNMISSLKSLEPLPSVIVYENGEYIKRHTKNLIKIDAIVIGKKSINQLIRTIEAFSRTPWWSVTTPYFILEQKKTYSDNNSALFEFLLKKDILITYYIALDDYGSVVITTMNPYVKRAPSSWKFLTTGKGQSALYTRKFNEDFICDEFYFDRTKFLSGHKIKIAVFNDEMTPYPEYIFNEKDIQYVVPFHNQLHMIALVKILNLTMDIYTNSSPPYYDLIRSDRYLYEQTDINLVVHNSEYYHNQYFSKSFPITFYYLNLMVRHRGLKSPFEKLQDYYGIWTLISMIVILIMTLITIKLINRNKGYAFLLFEILRLIINSAIDTKIGCASHKIFFSMVFLYFLIIHSTLSGHWIEFLMKSELRENIQTIEDLKNSEYQTIYYSSSAAPYIEGLEIDDKVMEKDDDTTCLTKSTVNELTVCVDVESTLLFYVSMLRTYNITTLYVPPKGFGFRYYTFFVRQQWSIRSRINDVFSYLFEANLHDIELTNFLQRIYRAERRYLERIQVDYRAIDLKILKFAFVILGIGLSCAFISFIIEINWEQIECKLQQSCNKIKINQISVK